MGDDATKSSLAEVDYYLHLAFRLGYMKAEVYERFESAKDEVARVLRGLMKAVAGRKKELRVSD